MNSQLFTQLVVGIILIIGSIVSAYVVPWLKVKVETTQMADLIGFVEKCVKWANQTIPEEEWKRKKYEVMQKVAKYVEDHTGLVLTEADLDAIIEAVVYSVKNKN